MTGIHVRAMQRALAGGAVLAAGLAVARAQALPPPPVPPENPITESKRILGKILFWDEHVSSNESVACGSCHRGAIGGSDGRNAVNPGPDGINPSPDDIIGSPGIVKLDEGNSPLLDPIYGTAPQVTGRSALAYIGAAYPPELFWDGRAHSQFSNPETGAVAIAAGGALENQATGPILNSVEMAHTNRTWADVEQKLRRSLPLGDATDLPADIASALASQPSYGVLFQSAFGDPAITAQRIAFAIATYERTLTADQTPWDRFVRGDPNAMTQGQQRGWNFFRTSPCSTCHRPPEFTDHTFRNIGFRPVAEDTGRQAVTNLFTDRGRFKVPTLRNAGLKLTHMHNGRINSMDAAVLWYRPNNPDRFGDNLDPILPVGVPPQEMPTLLDFLTNALSDPRVSGETAPFDRPTLHGGRLPVLEFAPDEATMNWPPLQGARQYNMYRGSLDDLRAAGPDGLPLAGYGVCMNAVDPNRTDTVFTDPDMPAPGHGFFYLKTVVDSHGAERGLGATRDGQARFVSAPCPPPGS